MSHSKATDSYLQRPIRSFVQRTGRITEAQRRAFNALWQDYGIDYAVQPLDLAAVFGRDARRTLEIGFGAGTSLVATAARYPEQDFLGIEVHEPGVGRWRCEDCNTSRRQYLRPRARVAVVRCSGLVRAKND